jgi:Na+/H+ antiporter NhaD/arsenite permease-like protein
MTTAQILALIIFIAMFLLIITDKIERHIVALVCAALTIVLVFTLTMHSASAVIDTLNIKSIFTLSFWYPGAGAESSSAGINWETIIFIAGMMVIVEGMSRVGFFRWLCVKLAKAVNFKPIPLFIVFMIMSSVLAMFIDSITVILFLAAATIELSKIIKIDPVPMILAEIFCANLGGAATMCGDPPNIIIGTALGYSFTDFITNTGLIAGISLIAVIIYYYFVFRKPLKAESADINPAVLPSPEDFITNKKDFAVCTVIFLIAIVLLVTHSQTGLSVATIGAFVAILTLLSKPSQCLSIIKSIDYKTLLFFIGLFVVVDGLSQTGILEMIASLIGSVSHGNIMIMAAIILWVSAVASAFIDNIPFAATMIPVISSLASANAVPLDTLVWALSMGTDIGGSATPIGASANVVGTSVAAKAGHPIGWGRYCKVNAPATIIVVLISMLIIFVRYC